MVKVEAHHLRLLCIDSERLSLCVRSKFLQHNVHALRVIKHEGKVKSGQHVGHRKFGMPVSAPFTPSAMLSMTFR